MHLSHSFGCLALCHTPKPIPLSHSFQSSFNVHASDCRHPQLSSTISNSSSPHHSTSPFSVLTVAFSMLIVLLYWWPSPNLSCGKSHLSHQTDVMGVDHITNNMVSIPYFSSPLFDQPTMHILAMMAIVWYLPEQLPKSL